METGNRLQVVSTTLRMARLPQAHILTVLMVASCTIIKAVVRYITSRSLQMYISRKYNHFKGQTMYMV